jgi:hypothetical protein
MPPQEVPGLGPIQFDSSISPEQQRMISTRLGAGTQVQSGPPSFQDIINDSDYQNLKPDAQLSIRRKFYQKHVAKDPDYLGLDQQGQQNITRRILYPGTEAEAKGPTGFTKFAVSRAGDVTQAAIEGAKELPGTIYGMAKDVGKAAVTPPKEGLWSFTPSHFLDVGKGIAGGLTAGIYKPEAKTEEEKARQTLGQLGGYAVPFAGASRALEAVGLPGAVSRIGAGAMLGAAEPASRGSLEEATKGAVTGGGIAGIMEAVPRFTKAPTEEVKPVVAGKPELVPSPETARATVSTVPIAQQIARAEAENQRLRAQVQKSPAKAQAAKVVSPAPSEVAPSADPVMKRVNVAMRKLASGEALTPEEEGFIAAIQQGQPTMTQAAVRKVPRPNIGQILKQQDIETQNQQLISDLNRVIRNPNESAIVKQSAVDQLSRLGVKPEIAEEKPIPSKAPLTPEGIAAVEEFTGKKPRAPRKSRAMPVTAQTFQAAVKKIGGLPPQEFPGEVRGYREMGKFQPGFWSSKSRMTWNEAAEQLHSWGFLPEPTTDALHEAIRDDVSGRKVISRQAESLEKSGQKASEEAAVQEVDDLAQKRMDELHGTTEPLEFQGKTYEGAVKEGQDLRLKDQPDKVLTKSEDILSVEEPSGFPWETEAPSATPMFERTEAGMQGVIPGGEGRSIPQKALQAKGRQAQGLTELEAVAEPKPPKDTTLFGGIPLPAIAQFGRQFIAEPLDRLRTAARTFYSPRSVSDIARSTSELLTRATSRVTEAERKVSELTRYSRAIMDLKPADEQLAFWDNMEKGIRQGNPLDQRVNDLLRTLLDENRNELTNRNLLRNIIDNYLPHQFDKPEVAQRVVADIEARMRRGRSLTGPNYFLRQRTLAGTVKDILESPEAQAAGLKLRYPNPVEAVEKLLYDSSRLIHGYDLLQKDLKPRGYVKLFRDPRTAPPGWREVEGYKPPRRPITDYSRPDQPTVFVEAGKYFAPEDVARILNNYTRPGLLSGDQPWVKPLQWFREGTGIANLANLGVSLFHGLTTAQGSLANEFKRGFMSLGEGNIGEATKRFASGATYVGPFIRDLKYGRELKAIANDPRMAVHHPETAKLINGYIDAGGRIDQTRPFFSRYVDDWLKSIEDRSIVEGGNGNLARLMKTALTGGTEGIMHGIVAPAKMAAFAKRFGDVLHSEPGLSEPELLHRASVIMDQVDDAFGLVNYDRWGVSRAVRDTAFIGLRAVGWTVGNLKILGGGLEDLARGKMSERAATMLGQLGAAMFSGTLLNLAFTGKLPSVDVRKPLESLYNIFNPESGGVNPDGTPTRIGFAGIHRDWENILFNIAKPLAQGDPMSAMQGMARFAGGKESPLIGMGSQLIQNRDFYGRPIVGKAGSGFEQVGQMAKGIGREMLPFSVTNVLSERKAGVERPWWQSGIIGMTPPVSKRATETKFMRLMEEAGTRSQQLSAVQDEHAQYKKQLFDRLANDKSVQDLLTSNKITPADVKEGMKRLNLQRQPNGALIYALNRPGVTLDDIAENAKAVTPQEAPVVLRYLNIKFYNAARSGRMTATRKKTYDEAKNVLQSMIPRQAEAMQ